MNIEYVSGKESHTSNWGEFYVFGLDNWAVKEDSPVNRRDNHHSYQLRVCNDVPVGTVFAVWERAGDKRGTHTYVIRLYEVIASGPENVRLSADYGDGYIVGKFQLLAEGNGKVKAPRLWGWWKNSKDHSLAFAQHCAKWIEKRGIDVLPPMEQQEEVISE